MPSRIARSAALGCAWLLAGLLPTTATHCSGQEDEVAQRADSRPEAAARQAPPPDPVTRDAEPPGAQSIDPQLLDVLAEISDIRSRLGSVAPDPLKDLPLVAGTDGTPGSADPRAVNPAPADFESSLLEILTRPERAELSLPEGEVDLKPLPIARRPQPPRELRRARATDVLVVALQESSRSYDERAFAAESVGDFDEADRLRKIAHAMRDEARRILREGRMAHRPGRPIYR